MGTQILWQRVDRPGHEISTLERHDDGWQLAGNVLVAQEDMPCELRYRIQCDSRWQTQSVSIRGHVGSKPVSVDLTRDSASEWHYDGKRVSEVEGCIDIDLGFSPSTNLLPIRRLSLPVGGRAAVRAAWLRFPEFSLELLEQAYTRIDADHYLYESANGAFRRELLIGADGFVLEYPDYWRVEAIMSFAD
jgi:hypothetical protein